MSKQISRAKVVKFPRNTMVMVIKRDHRDEVLIGVVTGGGILKKNCPLSP